MTKQTTDLSDSNTRSIELSDEKRSRAKGLDKAMIREVLGSPGLLISVIVLLVLFAWTLAPSLFASYDPLRADTSIVLQPPSWVHLFGTDELGRDIFTRVVFGTRVSIQAAGIALAIGVTAGTLVGLISGYVGGRVDSFVMRIVDCLMAFPSILLAMIIVTVLGFGSVQLGIAVGISNIGTVARVMRSEVLRIRKAVYVEAAISGGLRVWTILVRHIAPNAIGPVIALAVLQLGQIVLVIAALSFLGFGAPPPAPEWGSMMAQGQRYLTSAWWLSVLPGTVVVALVLAAHQIGHRLRQGRK